MKRHIPLLAALACGTLSSAPLRGAASPAEDGVQFSTSTPRRSHHGVVFPSTATVSPPANPAQFNSSTSPVYGPTLHTPWNAPVPSTAPVRRATQPL